MPNYHAGARTTHRARSQCFRTGVLAGCLALLLIGALAHRAAAEVQLGAGEPLVLVHPKINKSVGNPVLCLTFIDGGKRLATGATSGVLIWDVETGKLLQTLEVDERAVDSIALSPQGKLLVAGGATGVIKVFDAQTYKLLNTLGPTPGAVQALSISSDGKLLASASPNGQLGKRDEEFGIFLWDLTTGKQVRKVEHEPPGFGITGLAFLPSGKQIISVQDRRFRKIELPSGQAIQVTEQPDLTRSLGTLAVQANGQRLVTGAYEAKIRVWDVGEFKQLQSWDAHAQQPPPYQGVACINYSPDDRFILSGGMDSMACVWEAATGRKLLELNARGEVSARWVSGIVISPDGQHLAAAQYGGSATIWTLREE